MFTINCELNELHTYYVGYIYKNLDFKSNSYVIKLTYIHMHAQCNTLAFSGSAYLRG